MPSVPVSRVPHQPSPSYSRAEQAVRGVGRGKPALWRLSREYADALVDDWLTTHEREAAEAEAEQLIAAATLEVVR